MLEIILSDSMTQQGITLIVDLGTLIAGPEKLMLQNDPMI
jgi:hypothetical protein